MASSQGSGLFEKHIEKIILGVCVIVFLFVIFRYGIGTPRRVTLKGDLSVDAKAMLPSEPNPM